MTDLTDLSLLEAGAALRAGEVSSLELTRACLERIASLDPSLHAFLAVAPAPAEAQAAAARRRPAAARRPRALLRRGPGLGSGRLDPPAGGLLRRPRPQADLRPRLALRLDRLRLVARQRRRAGPLRRRGCAPVRDD